MAWSPGPAGIMAAVRRAIVLAIAVLVLVPAAAHAAPVTLAKVGDFSSPVYVTAPLGDTARVFVVEKGGTIQVLDGAARSTFLDITSKVDSTDNERGLLSMAFALDYSTSGLFYVYYTAKSPVGQVTIEEHRVDPANPDRADPSYARTLVTIPHDQQANHNGGQLQFGPDGLLYAGTGDGGSGGDPSGNAQTTAPAPPTVANGVNHDYRLGKLLRIDPATGAVSIFAYGLRNPWRFSYDRNTGDLVIGDVGQDRYEEVDFAAAPGDGAGANYGWNQYEGLHTYPGNAPAGGAPGTVLPVIEYPHGPACSITGGYVVRDAGPARARGHLPVRRQLHGRHLGRHAAGGHDAHARLHRGQRVELRRGRLRSRLRRVARRRRLPLREQRRVRRAGALRRPAARRHRRGAARPPRARLHPAARRRAPARAAHRRRHHPRALRRAVHGERERAGAHHARRARGRGAGPEDAHREGDAGGRRADDAAPEALQGDAPLDQAVAGPARAPGHGAHRRARGRSRGQRAQRDAARADRAVVAAQLPPRGVRPIS